LCLVSVLSGVKDGAAAVGCGVGTFLLFLFPEEALLDEELIFELEADGLDLADVEGLLFCGASFTAATKVRLANGKSIAISKLKPGEKVLATNTRTGKTQAEPITAILIHHDTNLYDLRIRVGRHVAVIHTTTSHLFWDPATRHWVKAATLRNGDPLRTPGRATAPVAPPRPSTGASSAR
jgi:hypothetical protein